MSDRNTGIRGSQIKDLTVDTADLKDNAVTGEKLNSNIVDDFTMKLSNNKLKIADRIELNQMRNAFDIAVQGSITEHGMIDGFKDFFIDESGVDTVNSLNEDYDAVNDLYKPTSVAGLELDYMEYATDGAAQAAYASSDSAYVSQYPPGHSDVYVKATTRHNTDFEPFYSTNPGKSLIGSMVNNQWQSTQPGNTANQRFNIDLGALKVITKIYYENSHNFGAITTRGIKNFVLQGSNDAESLTQLDYSSDTYWTDIKTDLQALEHVALDQADPQYFEFDNTTPYRYYSLKITDNWGSADTMGFRHIELQAIALQSYSESTIKQQGSYSLKVIASITDSLNDTLTKSGLSLDLTDIDELKLWAYASRTGTNLQIQIHDSGGTTSTKDIVISQADTWTEITWDISGITNADKDDIDSIIIKIINADAENTFYIDNFYVLGITNNMTLISNSETAEAQPDTGRIVIFEEDVDSITENTHLKSYISRDNGTTYSQITLQDEGDYGSGKRILTGTVDISGQPAGTSMRYKIETLSNKSLKLHGCGMLWN